tara:strand:- start:164 stop:1159 length:996 start_codon:yes stop_codon:yes gene_type:complete
VNTGIVRKLGERIRQGERRSLARAITLLESTLDPHRGEAEALLADVLPAAGRSIRLGITGVPGVGKSTFIEALGYRLAESGHRLAVLTIDPSSVISGGAVLGDKTRMGKLSSHSGVFIRPSPTGGSSGGVARRTRESILLCEAAGYDIIMVETVGVGQSELRVAGMTDFFILLLLPASGDELQGIKRGVMELADLILVNKADGDLDTVARRTVSDYQQAVGLIQPRTPGWKAPVLAVSALQDEGLGKVLETIHRFQAQDRESGLIEQRRSEQGREWLRQEVHDGLMDLCNREPEFVQLFRQFETEVCAGRLAATVAARKLVSDITRSKRAS